ncbi:MAG TPA: histidine kinase [Acidimicrobiales bacterium]
MTERPPESDELRASRARIVASSNEARRALERRLHDGPQQHLVAMAVKLSLIENALGDSADAAKEMLADLRGDVQETVQQLRDIASAIFPPLLNDRGLAEALRAAAARARGAVEVSVDASASGRYPLEVEAGVYFAAVEALHAVDGALAIELEEVAGSLRVRLRGNFAEGLLVHVADHAQTVGGTAYVSGDALVAEVPVS